MQFNLSDDEIVRRGREWYEKELRAKVEPRHRGEFLVIDVETGEYEIGRDDLEVSMRAKERFADRPLYAMRVGHRALYRIGYRGGAGPEC